MESASFTSHVSEVPDIYNDTSKGQGSTLEISSVRAVHILTTGSRITHHCTFQHYNILSVHILPNENTWLLLNSCGFVTSHLRRSHVNSYSSHSREGNEEEVLGIILRYVNKTDKYIHYTNFYNNIFIIWVNEE